MDSKPEEWTLEGWLRKNPHKNFFGIISLWVLLVELLLTIIVYFLKQSDNDSNLIGYALGTFFCLIIIGTLSGFSALLRREKSWLGLVSLLLNGGLLTFILFFLFYWPKC